MEARARLTSKYEFILPSDLPKFACRAIVSHASSIPKIAPPDGCPIAFAGAKNESRPISPWIGEQEAHEPVGSWEAISGPDLIYSHLRLSDDEALSEHKTFFYRFPNVSSHLSDDTEVGGHDENRSGNLTYVRDCAVCACLFSIRSNCRAYRSPRALLFGI